jgi:transcriptional regulator GlxA family with amidase domain
MEHQTTQIVFLILPQIHLMDLAGPDQVFYEAIDYGANIEVKYCSFSDNLSTKSGLPIDKIEHFSNIEFKSNDFLIVPGADVNYIHSEEFRQQKDLLIWIKNLYAQKVTICSVCTGAFVLAYSGVLNGKNCTTHWKRTAELQRCFPNLKVIENVLFNEHDNIYTSAGVASGIDLALHIVEKLEGERLAHKIARELVIYNRRNGSQPQKSELLNYRNHVHSGIHKVQDYLQENLKNKSALPDLAEIANMSERNFTRIFKREAGISANDYIRVLRKERATELLKNPDLSRTQIANLCGLQSKRQLSRIIND